MKNVGVSVGTTAMLLASSDGRDARDVAILIEAAAVARLELEARQSRTLIERAADRPAAATAERVVFDAWKKWYGEALDSVRRLPVGGRDRAVDEGVDAAIARVTGRRW